MPLIRRTVDGHDIEYWVIEYDKYGNELLDSGSLASDEVREALSASSATDVFVISHGWHGDWDGALAQYDAWVRAFLEATPAQTARPFRPFVVGVHWPSLAFAPTRVDRDAKSKTLSGSDDADPDDTSAPVSVDSAVDSYADLLGDTAAIRRALKTILDAEHAATPLEKSAPARTALRDLLRAIDLEEPPMPDAESEDDEDAVLARAVAEPGRVLGEGGLFGLPLLALRQLSFWKMKQRAYAVGTAGVSLLLRDLQSTAGTEARLHVMGHSFGCIVMSAAVLQGGSAPARPVRSMVLLQGALSLWAFADDAYGTGRPGRFRPLRERRFVDGPIVTSQSRFDYALGKFYPAGVRVASWIPGGADHLVLGEGGEVPKWGAVGTFGLQGTGAEALMIREVTADTRLAAGSAYNVDADAVIDDAKSGGWGGAHNDIAHAEIGRLVWRAALSEA
ncbi:MAG: hypothetical protein JST25_05500 [Actinobacteria bacterium]|nr:hypothetical protein [Actinomycetota bacterium]